MKYGLVLAGGGGKGSYQIGVWKALRELGIEIESVTGTSVGALNGALISQGSFDKAVELWTTINVERVLNVNQNIFNGLLNPSISGLPKLNRDILTNDISKIIKNKGLDISPLIELLSKAIDEQKVRQSEIDFGLVTVSLTDKCSLETFIKDIPQGKLHDYMLASSFLPCFAPIELDGKRFMDGGFYDNLPINLMVKKGVKNIIAVDLHAIGFKKHVNVKNLNIIYIEPSGNTGKMLDFNAEVSKNNIQMGYLDTLRTFRKLNGNLYYFVDYPDDEIMLPSINKINEHDILKVFELLKLKLPPTKRNLLENAIPKIANKFGCTREDNYADLVIRIIEYLADVHHIPRLIKYNYKKLIELIKNEMNITQPSGFVNYSLQSLKENLVFSSQKYKIAIFILERLCLFN